MTSKITRRAFIGRVSAAGLAAPLLRPGRPAHSAALELCFTAFRQVAARGYRRGRAGSFRPRVHRQQRQGQGLRIVRHRRIDPEEGGAEVSRRPPVPGLARNARQGGRPYRFGQRIHSRPHARARLDDRNQEKNACFLRETPDPRGLRSAKTDAGRAEKRRGHANGHPDSFP